MNETVDTDNSLMSSKRYIVRLRKHEPIAVSDVSDRYVSYILKYVPGLFKTYFDEKAKLWYFKPQVHDMYLIANGYWNPETGCRKGCMSFDHIKVINGGDIMPPISVSNITAVNKYTSDLEPKTCRGYSICYTIDNNILKFTNDRFVSINRVMPSKILRAVTLAEIKSEYIISSRGEVAKWL